jgi:hypothetical protein
MLLGLEDFQRRVRDSLGNVYSIVHKRQPTKEVVVSGQSGSVSIGWRQETITHNLPNVTKYSQTTGFTKVFEEDVLAGNPLLRGYICDVSAISFHLKGDPLSENLKRFERYAQGVEMRDYGFDLQYSMKRSPIFADSERVVLTVYQNPLRAMRRLILVKQPLTEWTEHWGADIQAIQAQHIAESEASRFELETIVDWDSNKAQKDGETDKMRCWVRHVPRYLVPCSEDRLEHREG